MCNGVMCVQVCNGAMCVLVCFFDGFILFYFREFLPVLWWASSVPMELASLCQVCLRVRVVYVCASVVCVHVCECGVWV